MTKTSSLALVAMALTAMVGFSLPATADDDAGTSFNDDLVAAGLADRGIKVADLAETAFGTVRASVVQPDGSIRFEYFDPDTLQPVTMSGDSTKARVLSQLDTGSHASTAKVHSLTWEGTSDD